jgi:hypothetical protein
MRIINEIAAPKQTKKSCELSACVCVCALERENYNNKTKEIQHFCKLNIPQNNNLHLLSPFNSISRISEP